MEHLIGSQKDLMNQYIDTLDKSHKWSTKEAKEARDRIIRLKGIEDQESHVRGVYTDSIQKSADQINASTKQKNKATADLLRAGAKIGAQRDALRDAANESLAAANKALAREHALAVDTAKIYQKQNAVIAGATEERKKLEAQQAQISTQVWQGAKESMVKQIDKVFSSEALVAALKEGYDTVAISAATSTGISLSNIFSAASLGFKPSEFIKMQSEYGQTEAAMVGGQDAFIGALKSGEGAYRDMIIDTKERTALLASHLQILTDSGIRPAAQYSAMFADTVHRASKMTHKSAESITADLASIASDEGTQTLLKIAATESERAAIIQGTNAVYANNIAMGMSTKQAVAAAQSLNKLQAQTAKTRLGEAARIRVLGGALGMGRQGAELASIRTKGVHASPEEKARAAEISTAMSAKVAEMKGGGLAQQLTVESLTEGLKLDEQFGPSSPFSNTLGANTNALLEPAHETVTWLTKIAATVDEWKSTILQNPIITGAAGAVGTIAGFLTGQSMGNMLLGKIAMNTGGLPGKGIFDKLLGGGKGAAGGAAEGAIATEGAAMGVAGTAAIAVAATAAALAAGAAVDAGLGKMGVGGKKINEVQDEANWNKATVGEKISSGFARSIEKVGSFVFLDNMANQARADRIVSETEYLKKKDELAADSGQTPAGVEAAKTVDTISDQLKKMDTTNDLLKSISENSADSAEFSEKLVYLMTMSEKDRTNSSTQQRLMANNRFGSQYQYVT
jgi:hypothetical protein